MPASAATFANLLEYALVFAGFVLLWRLVLSPAARAQPASAQLAPWDASFTDLLLFLWLTFCGGLVLPLVIQLSTRSLPSSDPVLRLVLNAGFQLGMLLGVGAYHRFFAKRPLDPVPRQPATPVATFLAGGATFLIALPCIVVIGLLWLGLMKLIGLPPEAQDAVLFFKSHQPLYLVIPMIVLATVVAPITEELIFRAGLFRYTRTRLPRWAALLLPACLFSALHGSFTSFAPLAALGIVFSIAYERTGRIGTSMVAHALFNLYSVARIFLDPTAS